MNQNQLENELFREIDNKGNKPEYLNKQFILLRYDPDEDLIEIAKSDNLYDLFDKWLDSLQDEYPEEIEWSIEKLENLTEETFINDIKNEKLKYLCAFIILNGPYDFVIGEPDKEVDYLESLPESYPDAKLLFAWTAVPPYQDDAFAIVQL